MTVLIHAKNEERNIAHAVASVIGWANEVFVVDSDSTDGTQAAARMAGATVVSRTCSRDGLVEQRNWALSTLPIRNDWVFILDADEVVTPELRSEIDGILALTEDHVDGYWCRFKVFFGGKWIKHASMYPTWSMRLFRHASVRYENRQVNAHPLVPRERARYLRGHVINCDRRPFSYYLQRLDEFSSLEAQAYADVLNKSRRSRLLVGKPWGSAPERRRFLKHLYIHMPARPVLMFMFLYFWRLGILDGRPGLNYAVWKAAAEWATSIKIGELQAKSPS